MAKVTNDNDGFPMRIAYLDCFSGMSGDMFLGALVDAGVPAKLFEDTVAALNIGARLEISRVNAQRHQRDQGGCLRQRRKRIAARGFPRAAESRADSMNTGMNTVTSMRPNMSSFASITTVSPDMTARGRGRPRHTA